MLRKLHNCKRTKANTILTTERIPAILDIKQFTCNILRWQAATHELTL
jgi:hypothetical protein